MLARRHIDVRNAMLKLKERGIKAQATGLLTAEGAAATSVVLTLAEGGNPHSALAFALVATLLARADQRDNKRSNREVPAKAVNADTISARSLRARS